MFRLNSKSLRGFSITPVAVDPRERDEFFAYSDVYRSRGETGYIKVEIRLPEGRVQASEIPLSDLRERAPAGGSNQLVQRVAPPEGLPGKNLSGFDVVKDGSLRQRFLEWASDISNWPDQTDSASIYAKLVVATGRSLYTGADFQILAEFHFRDGSTATTYYQSSTQRLHISEVRDSVGNLIYTDSKDEVPVDYSSYMMPGAFLQPDYARGIDFLWRRGAMSPDGQIKRGTVIVKDMVSVREQD